MIRFPTGAEAAIARRLLQRLRVLEAVLGEQSIDATREQVLAAIDATRRALAASLARLPAALEVAARQITGQTATAVLTEFRKQTGTNAAGDLRLVALARDLDTERVRWVARVAAYASKAEQETLDRLAARVGADPARARTIVREEVARLRGRLQLIARDQSGHLQSAANRATQTALGAARYVWVSQDDERVRSSHEGLHGTVREWAVPHPTEGHPGDAIGCRCVARPLFVGRA